MIAPLAVLRPPTALGIRGASQASSGSRPNAWPWNGWPLRMEWLPTLYQAVINF